MAQATPPLVKSGKAANAGGKAMVETRTFMRDDFPIIRSAVVKLLVGLLVSGMMIAGSRYFLAQEEAKKASAITGLREVKQKFSSATIEKNDIIDFQPKYLRLAQRGVVGEEKRLDFVEQVRAIQEKRQLQSVSYEVFPQQVLQLDPTQSTGELELRGSRVLVKLSLLHELDLLNFLQDLREQGWLVPQSCLIRATDVPADFPLNAHQQGECSLVWLTIGKRVAADAVAVSAQ